MVLFHIKYDTIIFNKIQWLTGIRGSIILSREYINKYKGRHGNEQKKRNNGGRGTETIGAD